MQKQDKYLLILQQQLVIDDIEPAIELLTDLLKMGDLAKT